MAVAQNQRKGASERKLLHDPIEDDEAIKVLVELAGAKADSEIPSEPWSLGRCHAVWARMKKILKDEHGITWYSPQEMNPFVRFD